MFQPTLIGNQDEHANTMLNTLCAHMRAIDYSPTGSGKTYVAAYVVYKLLCQENIKHVHIICPPSLKHNWENVFGTFDLPITLIHGYGLGHFPSYEDSVVICDEFHYLKNESQRYYRMLDLFEQSKYVICLSATPVDRVSQYSHYRRLLGVDSRDVRVKCDYTIDTKQDVMYSSDPVLNENLTTTYRKGYREITTCHPRPDGTFFGARYTRGLITIHESIINSMITIIERELEYPNRKVIVIEQFTVCVRQLVDALHEYDPLTLNGKTTNRQEVIDLFQTPSTKHRLLITSAAIGGVGLSLDDQDGGYPRTTVISPIGNFCEFKQVLGRTHRRNTKSNSRVIIAQPHESVKSTYMKNMLEKKGAVFEAFSNKTDDDEVIKDDEKVKKV